MPLSQLNDNAELDLSQSKILVVDDQPINIQTIYNILSEEYVVLAATSGEEAIEVLKDNLPDLILLDVFLPNKARNELCQCVKQRLELGNIPIIFVISMHQPEEEDACWQGGGIDFITKPISPLTLKNRVKSHLTLKFQTDMLQKLVFIDGLTGVFNRRYFDIHLNKQENKSIRCRNDTAILMIDIDYFKLFNDHYSHIKGDEALKTVAELIRSALLRPLDFVCRYGGEEFVVVLPDTNIFGALKVAERIRKSIYNKKIVHVCSPHHFVTVSIGASTFLESIDEKHHPVEEADRYLYEAKKAGRNQVYCPVEHFYKTSRKQDETNTIKSI
ncbi:diguanylate cyclase [Motilimonas cestriensis]|uniref:diguanylate cyclase n=1 Tax=Motilimonas cestriensis TaxID=2742685 RepID=A0ABS8W9Q4_9GAMM|nr:diguanylate cyclase [Motilimonas cestriensis]MCE2595210.1 diguanylate cyclase [Motilimonas cestriensis]